LEHKQKIIRIVGGAVNWRMFKSPTEKRKVNLFKLPFIKLDGRKKE